MRYQLQQLQNEPRAVLGRRLYCGAAAAAAAATAADGARGGIADPITAGSDREESAGISACLGAERADGLGYDPRKSPAINLRMIHQHDRHQIADSAWLQTRRQMLPSESCCVHEA